MWGEEAHALQVERGEEGAYTHGFQVPPSGWARCRCHRHSVDSIECDDELDAEGGEPGPDRRHHERGPVGGAAFGCRGAGLANDRLRVRDGAYRRRCIGERRLVGDRLGDQHEWRQVVGPAGSAADHGRLGRPVQRLDLPDLPRSRSFGRLQRALRAMARGEPRPRQPRQRAGGRRRPLVGRTGVVVADRGAPGRNRGRSG